MIALGAEVPTSLRTEHHATRGTLARVGTRDDRVLPETRVASLIVTLVLIPAVVILWGPERGPCF